MASVEYPLLDDLRATLAEKAPFCSGTFKIPVRDFDLWYGKKNAQCAFLLASRACTATVSPEIDNPFCHSQIRQSVLYVSRERGCAQSARGCVPAGLVWEERPDGV